MLIARRCTYTGVLNFYEDADPHLAVGSVARCGTSETLPPGTHAVGFSWRCYGVDTPSAGLAPDDETASRRLTNYYALVQSLSPEDRAPFSA